MKEFDPIAIIGQGCVLPGCFSPEDLWQMVFDNKVNIQAAHPQSWRVDMSEVLVAPGEKSGVNKAWNSQGGYVTGFERLFDPRSFELDPILIAGLDPVFKWSFYAAQAALQHAGYAGHNNRRRTGLIMGNLSYPCRAFSQYFEEKYLASLFPEWKNPATPAEAVNRFMSGLPAMLTAKAIGLQGEAFALDAACASSLYALKLGCDKLQNGTADMMLIGGVCAADQLFLHVGFTALNALSPSGQSRPFNREADGLIPSEGAGFVVIKRLQDAIRDQDDILGVVRGIGLSNDGRQGGFLSPAQSGQVQSMKKALAIAGLPPEAVSYIECHATGTSGGDAVEIKSLQEVYGQVPAMHLSSLKGNIGHAITASGIGSIIKVLGAFRHKILPPSPNVNPLNDHLTNTIFSVSEAPAGWNSLENRVAGISNFGFGGNNAHLILEEWNPQTTYPARVGEPEKAKVAIVGLEIQSEKFADARAYLSHLLGQKTKESRKKDITFNAKKLSSPPNDLKYALGQQLLMLHTTQNLLAQGIKLNKDTTGVFIGIGTDAEINRYGFRKRLKELLDLGEIPAGAYDLGALETAIGPVLNAAGVLGTMPNIPANRINHQFDFCGMGFTVSAEELSGLKALEIAIQAIRNKELDSALVGAVDVSNEPVHQAALKEVLDMTLPTADLALVLALKNYDQAVLDGDTILASIGSEEERPEVYTLDRDWILAHMGYSHASSGLLEVANAVLLTRHRLQLNAERTSLTPILENNTGFAYTVQVSSLFGGRNDFLISSEPVEQVQVRTTGEVMIHCFAAGNKADLLVAIQENRCSEAGAHRLGIVSTKENLEEHRNQAITLLQAGKIQRGWLTEHIHYRPEQVSGELAFVFTGAASAYPQMGKELLQEFPGLIGSLQPCCNNPAFAGGWIYEDGNSKAKLPFYQLAGSSLMCQVHASFMQKVLGLQAQAAIGLSSGETNAMYALGVWEDMDGLLQDIHNSDLYQSALGVDFNSVKKHWGLSASEEVNWENWRILAPVSVVEALLDKEEKAYLTIVNTRNDCVIGGDREACGRILQAIGPHRAMPLHHDIAVHCAPVTPFEKTWRQLHTRKVNPVAGVRFYSNYLDGVYAPTSGTVADALTGQALQPIDFPRIIEKAWTDGVRVFVEHGPRNSLSTAIREILKGKDFVTVSLDRFGKSGLVEALRASTELWCAGVQVNLQALKNQNQPLGLAPEIEIQFPLHPSEIINEIAVNKNMQLNNLPANTNNDITRVLDRAPQVALTKRTRRETPVEHVVPLEEAAGWDNNLRQVPAVSAPVLSEQKTVLVAALNFAETAPVDPVLNLIKNQHAFMLEAHNHFLQAQLQGQQDYIGLMQQMMHQVMAAGEEHMRSPELVENVYGIAEIQPEQLVQITGRFIPESILTEIKEAEKWPAAQGPVAGERQDTLPGPKFSRQQLEVLSSGRISSVFGPLFQKQDHYAIQVRMPEPPLLLCDRVTGIQGEPGTLGLGTIWTETDVTDKSWYLHNNRMPPGIFIEAGQADLLLISYLGIDFQNQGERAYRLLGCELTFYGGLPKPGETLKYEIHVDGYAKSGETTLFFFHYDCHVNGKLRISVRNGQAGFFSGQELEDSKGVIWDPAMAAYAPGENRTLENATKKKAFSAPEIEAYTQGDMVTCFGKELAATKPHTRTPRSQAGYQNFIKDVTAFDLTGGPAGRGYLRSETIVNPDDWYFKGHFKNDACMPGTLMADACLQMMAFYIVGAGLTTTKDGWRFEPVTDEKYKFVCRGQVTPASKKVTYEIFVDQVIGGDYPTIYAHVLTTVDGTKAFLCEGLGLRLVPDWPLATMRHLVKADVPGKAIASYKGFKFGYESLINCALGSPADAFGPDFSHYDGGARSPRLPGPPYHFMTRIADYKVVPGEYKNDPYVVAEYDIPADAWYFSENGSANMPYGVLMEVALQPCGWFSTFICQHDIKGKDLMFRNLDGKAVQHRPVVPADKTIVTKTALTGISVMGEIIIIKFEVTSTIENQPVFTMNTVFGFFDADSMKTQKGLAITEEERANLSLLHNLNFKLTSFPNQYFSDSSARLPASKLLMIDRIVSFYPDGGKFGLGYLKSEKDVEKEEWFFKAHFFQDPVQPGSLGIEAMVQLMQFYMLNQGFHKRFRQPHFEPIAISTETEWHYRGQVTPDKKLISVDFEVKEVREAAGAVTVMGEARLWADGLKIYHAPGIGMRVVERNSGELAG